MRQIYASFHVVHLQVGTVLENYEDTDIPFLWFHSFGEAFVRPSPALCPHCYPAQGTCARWYHQQESSVLLLAL